MPDDGSPERRPVGAAGPGPRAADVFDREAFARRIEAVKAQRAEALARRGIDAGAVEAAAAAAFRTMRGGAAAMHRPPHALRRAEPPPNDPGKRAGELLRPAFVAAPAADAGEGDTLRHRPAAAPAPPPRSDAEPLVAPRRRDWRRPPPGPRRLALSGAVLLAGLAAMALTIEAPAVAPPAPVAVAPAPPPPAISALPPVIWTKASPGPTSVSPAVTPVIPAFAARPAGAAPAPRLDAVSTPSLNLATRPWPPAGTEPTTLATPVPTVAVDTPAPLPPVAVATAAPRPAPANPNPAPLAAADPAPERMAQPTPAPTAPPPLAAVAPAASIPAAAPGRRSVAVHAPSSVSDTALAAAVATVGAADSVDAWPVRVRMPIGATHVRYFHASDRAAAAAIAATVGGELRDFTSFSPPPSPGRLELWLAGDASRAGNSPAIRQASQAAAPPPTARTESRVSVADRPGKPAFGRLLGRFGLGGIPAHDRIRR